MPLISASEGITPGLKEEKEDGEVGEGEAGEGGGAGIREGE